MGETKERALAKADAQISYLKLEIELLNTNPLMGLATTQMMIDGQIKFKQTEQDTWEHIKQALLQY